jgi:hydrophobe/amphiphile efflux-1 (HAE1) family protein
MHPSATFINRPIATSLLMLGIAIFGVVAYRALPVADLPNVDYPTLNVSASLPGADPDTMASAVATPLERQFTGIAGVDSIISSNSTGNTNITLQFDPSRDIDSAAVDVQTAISEAMPLLPAGMPSPPSFRKSNPADRPIMFLGLTSDTLPLWQVDDFAERVLAQRISMVEGVAQVRVLGAQKFAVRVQVDPDKLAAKNIGLNEVSDALRSWNVNVPTGTLHGPATAYNVETTGQLFNAEEFKPVIIAWRNGAPVRLDEVAHVIDSVEDDKTASWYYENGQGVRAIHLMIMRQPGTNTIEVVDAVKRLLPSFEAQLPPAMKLVVRGDRSKNIRESFKDIQITMAVTLALVILVIFLFLRNTSATTIPALALPFSLLGAFAVMYVLNFSLDNLSLMALILSIGFVVDDAIVMLENIVRHIESGERPFQAALRGSREIGFTIVSMTLSLAAVFIPVLFMGGILGKLFREFAVTITVTILISGVVSISLTPMLCSRLLRARGEQKQSWIFRKTEWAFVAMHGWYARSLAMVLRHRGVMAAVFVIVLGATFYLFKIVPKGFIPETDDDMLSVSLEAAQGTSFYQMSKYMEQVSNIMKDDPNIEDMMVSTGGGWMGASNSGRIFVHLKPRSERQLSAQELVTKLRPKLAGIPGLRAFVMLPQSLHIGGRMSSSSYDFTLQSTDLKELYQQAAVMETAMARLPGLVDVNTDLEMRSPRINIQIDHDRAAALQLNSSQIESTLYDAFGPRWASTIYSPVDQYRVLLQFDPKYQEHPDALSKLYFRSADGHLVPLDAFAKITHDVGPQTVNHSGQLPSVTISFSLKPGVSLGDAVQEVSDLAARILPANMTASFQGAAQAFQSSLKNLTLLLVVAILVVYIVLGVLYESYVHPLTILSGLPSAGFGALLTLLIFRVDLSIYAFVGLMMLIGIVKKNAIMQIDFALEVERREGKTPAEAIFEGCLIRFRPIMMTTMAALLGAIPMALGYGAGGEARRPLGLTVAGGLFFSQLMTLYLTPVVYTYMAAILNWRKRRKPAAAAFPAPEPQPTSGD